MYIHTFLRPAGDADRSRAGELRELADQRPDRSARRGDHHRFAQLWFPDQPAQGTPPAGRSASPICASAASAWGSQQVISMAR